MTRHTTLALGAVFVACIVPILGEPPALYLPPSGFTSMPHFGGPSPSPFGLTAPSIFPSQATFPTISPSYSTPHKTYGPPSPTPVYRAPAPVYSPPKQSKTYLPPIGGLSSYSASGSRGYHEDNYHSEPAHYEYQYTVQDPHYGTDFGHKEARQGDVATGSYMVLLPDGRRQIVDYIADQHGYRPTIRYEGTAIKHGY